MKSVNQKDLNEPSATATVVKASGQAHAFKDLALLQAFSNVMLTSINTVSNRWAGGDFISATIFCAFFLAATSDSTRSILYGTAAGSSAMQDGLLSVSSISQMTGIPRETVRRKCVELAEKGMISREGSRLYRCVIPDDMTSDLSAKIDSIIQLNNRLTQH
ncbi:MAG: hypothetical protein RLZZ141_565 [Pseudomonadota bacterium]|jgi:hypothetical protein